MRLYDKIIDVTFFSFESGHDEDNSDVKNYTEVNNLQTKKLTKAQWEALAESKTIGGRKFALYPAYISHPNDDEYIIPAEPIYKVTRQEAYLKCPVSGMKPTISIEFGLLPGQYVYLVTLRVTNLNLPFDIRHVDRLLIKCGYADQEGQNSLTQQFTISVLSSSVESPPPDGITAFRGIICDSFDNFFSTQKIHIVLKKNGDKLYTVNDFIEAFERGMPVMELRNSDGTLTSQNVTVRRAYLDGDDPTKGYNAIEVCSEYDKTFSSGYQAACDIADLITNAINSKRPAGAKTIDMSVVVLNNSLIFLDNSFDAAKEAITQNHPIITLDHVRSANLTGPVIDVVAPWVPPLLPGDIFMMDLNYYNAEQTPNAIDINAYKTTLNAGGKSKTGFYWRVITIKVRFDTTGNTNEMIIKAVATTKEQEIETLRSELPASELADYIKKAQERIETGGPLSRIVAVGDHEEPVQQLDQVLSVNSNDDYWEDYLVTFKRTDKLVDYTFLVGLCAGFNIGHNGLYNSVHEPGLYENPVFKTTESERKQVSGASTTGSDIRGPTGLVDILEARHLWPLIVIGTMKQRQTNLGAGYYKFDPGWVSPYGTTLKKGTLLRIPKSSVLVNASALQNYKSCIEPLKDLMNTGNYTAQRDCKLLLAYLQGV